MANAVVFWKIACMCSRAVSPVTVREGDVENLAWLRVAFAC